MSRHNNKMAVSIASKLAMLVGSRKVCAGNAFTKGTYGGLTIPQMSMCVLFTLPSNTGGSTRSVRNMSQCKLDGI